MERGSALESPTRSGGALRDSRGLSDERLPLSPAAPLKAVAPGTSAEASQTDSTDEHMHVALLDRLRSDGEQAGGRWVGEVGG